VPHHRLQIDQPVSVGLCTITGEEAHHAARVKRVAVGESVEVLDGRGGVGRGSVSALHKDRAGWTVDVTVESASVAERPLPALEVCSAIPKGAKLSEVIDGLAQVGAAAWRPLEAARSVREHWRPEKLECVAAEASKQCGRAWRMEIGTAITFGEASNGAEVIVADASGECFNGTGDAARLLVGPEGGWTGEELEQARAAGTRICRFGVHTMRIETAAIVAAGIIMNRPR
jgi:16S rRNA (uracil1498-N3)-methyltransferase